MAASTDIRYSYKNVPTIREFAASDARIRGLLGPLRSGKSSGSVVEIVRRANAQQPGPDGIRRTRWLVVRNTFRQLEDSTIKTTLMWLPESRFGRYKSSEHNYYVNGFPGVEFEIWFRALDRPDHVKNLLSVEVTGAWVNEAREVPWAIIRALDGRIGQYPPKMMGGPTWSGMWLDTNPPDAESEWYEFFEERKHDPSRVAIFKQPGGRSAHAENLDNLNSRSYYDDVAYGKPDEWINVYVNGEYGFVAEGKAIYPEYNDKLHCVALEPVEGVTVIRSLDFGLQPACAFSQLLPDGRWLTFDEMVSEDMGIDQFSDRVLEHCSRAFRGNVKFEDWGDPAGDQRAQTDERTCFDIMLAKGFRIRGSEQDPTLRWESVRKPLRTLTGVGPQFILHPRCKVLRKGFMGGYHRRQLQVSGETRYADKANKNRFSHIHDALQYGTVQYFRSALTRPASEDSDWPEPEYMRDSFSDVPGFTGRNPTTGY